MVLATAENHLNFWTPLFADKPWVRGSWSGGRYIINFRQLLSDTQWATWWYPQGGGPLCDTHYTVVGHSDCTGIVCTYCELTLRQDTQVRGSDVGINGVEGISTTSNYWNVHSAFEFCKFPSKVDFLFHSHWLLFVKCKSFSGLMRVVESQYCYYPKNQKLVLASRWLVHETSGEKYPQDGTSSRGSTFIQIGHRSDTVGRMVCIDLIWERGPTENRDGGH